MSRFRLIAASFLAAFALGAVAAAQASAALPELVNAKGEVPVKNHFKSTSGEGTFETVGGAKLTCKEDKDEGEITGPKADKVTITFTGCEALKVACNTSGGKSGEIKFSANSELVYISEAAKTVGEVLSPTSEITIKCTAFETLKVRGSLICPITPVKELSTTATLSCKQSKGVQEPTEYEEAGNKHKEVTETEATGLIEKFKWEQSGLQSTDTLTFEEGVEIKA